LEYHLLLSRDLGYLKIADFEIIIGKVSEVKKMLTALIKKLRADR
jgi:four helix bundle protein